MNNVNNITVRDTWFNNKYSVITIQSVMAMSVSEHWQTITGIWFWYFLLILIYLHAVHRVLILFLKAILNDIY